MFDEIKLEDVVNNKDEEVDEEDAYHDNPSFPSTHEPHNIRRGIRSRYYIF